MEVPIHDQFFPIDAGKDAVLDYLQITNSFALTTDGLAHFPHKKNKLYFREISAAVRGSRGGKGGRVGRDRGGGNGRSCDLKPRDQNYPTIYDRKYSPKQWSFTTW